MKIEEVERIFQSENEQSIAMMARKFLCNGRTHESVKELSQSSEKFTILLSKTDQKNKDYLSLVYILDEHLNDVKSGKCPCTIIKKSMFNCPSRLEGILEVLEEKFIEEKYTFWCHSKCISCGQEYESERVPCGHGERVLWKPCS